jgi:nitrate/nitrite transport system substrate-binding protein
MHARLPCLHGAAIFLLTLESIGATSLMALTRRELLRELLAAGLTMGTAASILSGCGGNSASTSGGGTAASSGGASSGDATASAGGPIKIGFIPLTDCASVVMAHELGLYKKHGVDVTVEKQANWAVLRDKLSTNELQGAHCLFGMPFSTAAGVSEVKGDPLKIAMVLNNNGQATTLSKEAFPNVGYNDAAGFKKAVEALQKADKTPTFAMTYPGGTHDMWIRLTLANAGVDIKKVKIKVIPPPQMVANMAAKNMDGYNVGEPWGGKAVADGIGFTYIATQDLWQHHPEKALVVNNTFATTRRDDLKKVMMAVMEASQFLDDKAKFAANRAETAKKIGTTLYVNAKPEVIQARLVGDYNLGTKPGKMAFKDDTMLFHRGGETNYPRLGYGVWFLTQYQRFGLIDKAPAYEAMAKDVILTDLYKEVAKEMKVAVPDDDMAPFQVAADAGSFDPGKPEAALKQYATAFEKMSRLA